MPEKRVQSEKTEEKTFSIEENFEQLEALIKKMESAEGSLEDCFAGYEAGMKLVRVLNSQIDRVEKQIQILSEDDENEQHGDI